MLLALVLADLGIVVVARARAQTAADAAALAAAGDLVIGGGNNPAARAAEYARANGGVLNECQCSPGTREVQVAVSFPVNLTILDLGGRRAVPAAARSEVDVDRLNRLLQEGMPIDIEELRRRLRPGDRAPR